MLTRIEVVADPVRDRCLLTTGLLSPRRLPAPDGVVRIALIAASALLLAGDQVEIQVVIKGPVRLEIVETAGTVAYAMRGGSAKWDVMITLTEGAQLTWHGEPFVVAEGADVTRTMQVNLESGCSAAIRESLVLGRHGEVGGTLRSSQRAWLDGELLLAEDLDLTPEARHGWAILGTARCLDSITTLGCRLQEAQKAPAVRGAPEAPAGNATETPELRKTTGVQEAPGVRDAPGARERREVSGAPQARGVRDAIGAWEVSGVPAARDTLGAREVAGMPATRDTLGAREVAGMPATQDAPGAREVAGMPAARDTLGAREVAGVAEVPRAWEVVDGPGLAGVLQLEGTGSVVRRLVGEQHESDLAQTWAALREPDKISGCS